MKLFTSSELQKEIKDFMEKSKNNKIDIALHDHIKRIIKNSDLSELNHQELEIVNIIEKEIDFFKKIYLHYSYNYGLDVDINLLKKGLETNPCKDLGILINIENLFYKDDLNLEFIIFLKEVFGFMPVLKQNRAIRINSTFKVIDEKKIVKMIDQPHMINAINPYHSFNSFFSTEMDRKDLKKYMDFLRNNNKKSFNKINILNYLDDLDDFYDYLDDDEEFFDFYHNTEYLRKVFNNLILKIDKKINLANKELSSFYNEYINEILIKKEDLMITYPEILRK